MVKGLNLFAVNPQGKIERQHGGDSQKRIDKTSANSKNGVV